MESGLPGHEQYTLEKIESLYECAQDGERQLKALVGNVQRLLQLMASQTQLRNIAAGSGSTAAGVAQRPSSAVLPSPAVDTTAASSLLSTSFSPATGSITKTVAPSSLTSFSPATVVEAMGGGIGAKSSLSASTNASNSRVTAIVELQQQYLFSASQLGDSLNRVMLHREHLRQMAETMRDAPLDTQLVETRNSLLELSKQKTSKLAQLIAQLRKLQASLAILSNEQGAERR